MEDGVVVEARLREGDEGCGRRGRGVEVEGHDERAAGGVERQRPRLLGVEALLRRRRTAGVARCGCSTLSQPLTVSAVSVAALVDEDEPPPQPAATSASVNDGDGGDPQHGTKGS